MAEEFQLLLVEQQLNISSIKRVLINFKKLAKVNVTLPKTKGRFSDLKELWEKTRQLHARLQHIATAEQKKTTSYFSDDLFNSAEEAYYEAANHLNDTISKFTTFEPMDRSTDTSYRETSVGTSLHLPRIPLLKFSGKFTE